jgi:hypothetical protein
MGTVSVSGIGVAVGESSGMNCLKIKTADGIHREIDMIEYAVYSRNADRVFDSIIETDNGTQTVYPRARRRSFAISINGIDRSSLAILEAIWRDRQECHFEGNVGEDTKVYNPFESSSSNLIGGASSFARASIASYLGEDGLIRAVASGYPRFEACKIGNGILLEPERINYFFPSHGDTGVTLWTSAAGSPAIAWDTNIASNVYGKLGTVRLEMSSATPDIVKTTISGLTPATVYSCYIWARGSGTIILSVTGATGTITSGAKSLSMAWQLIPVEGFIATGTSVDMQIMAASVGARLWLSAHQLEAGHVYTSYIPTTSAAATRLIDQWIVSTVGNYAEGSIAFWLKFPRITSGADGTRILWYMNSNFYGKIDPDGMITFSIASGVVVAVAQAMHRFVAGDAVHLAFVWKHNYCAIIANGIDLGSTSSNVRVSGADSIIYLYHSTNAPQTVIDDFRYDDRYVEWRLSQNGLYGRYSNSWNLALCELTQGRKFRIKNPAFKEKEANPGYYDGNMQLEESSSDEYYTIGAK